MPRESAPFSVETNEPTTSPSAVPSFGVGPHRRLACAHRMADTGRRAVRNELAGGADLVSQAATKRAFAVFATNSSGARPSRYDRHGLTAAPKSDSNGGSPRSFRSDG